MITGSDIVFAIDGVSVQDMDDLIVYQADKSLAIEIAPGERLRR